MSLRCIVSDRLQTIVVLLPKNASSTLGKVLSAAPFEGQSMAWHHIDPERRDRYRRWCFLRDPVNRCLSAYQEVSMRIGRGELDGRGYDVWAMGDSLARFERFLELLGRENWHVQWDVHLRQQTELLRDIHIDRFGCVEWLQEDLGQALRSLGLDPLDPLPVLRSRDGRRERFRYHAHDFREQQLEISVIQRIEHLYRDDMRLYRQQVIDRLVHDGSLGQRLRALNDSAGRQLVYHLGDRGFIAEVSSVARALLFATANNLRLRLSSAAFTAGVEHGWTDYFRNICPPYLAQDAAPDDIHCHSNRRGPGTVFNGVRGYRLSSLCFQGLVLRDNDFIQGVFARLVFYPNAAVTALRQALEPGLALPPRYAAIHIRRGDKVDDEDVYYAPQVYWRRLEELGIGSEPLFVMSDDRAAVTEFRTWLEAHGRHNRVVTLCRPDDRGFDISAYRDGRPFNRFALASAEASASGEFDRGESLRLLLVEMLIAADAALFVGSFRSNVSRMVWYLLGNPERALLHPTDAGG